MTNTYDNTGWQCGEHSSKCELSSMNYRHKPHISTYASLTEVLAAEHREFIITGTKAGSKPATTDVKAEPAANGTKAAANGKSGQQRPRPYSLTSSCAVQALPVQT